VDDFANMMHCGDWCAAMSTWALLILFILSVYYAFLIRIIFTRTKGILTQRSRHACL